MANNSIALLAKVPEFDTPLESQGKAMQIRQLMNQGQVQDMELQQRRQAMADDALTREAYAANPDDAAARLKALARSPKAYQAERKALQDAEKVTADIGQTKANTRKAHIEAATKVLDAAGQTLGFVVANPTLPNALSALDYLGRNGIYTPEDVAHYKEVVTKDPTQIKALAEQAYRGAIDAKDQLPKIDTRNLGNRMETRSIDPISGKTVMLDSQAISQSPDSVASNATTRRGQNMVDARSREQNENGRGVIIQTDTGPMLANPRDGTTRQIIGPDGKPVTRTKPLTEFQGKSAAFGDRAMASDKLLTQLEKNGVANTGIIKSIATGAGEMVPFIGDKVGAAIGSGMNALPSALGGPNEKQQQTEQARRDFVNATLRQESGAAIAESEFANATRQYFPQPGDTADVIKQKAANRKLVIAGFKRSAGANADFTDAAPDNGGWTVTPIQGK